VTASLSTSGFSLQVYIKFNFLSAAAVNGYENDRA